MELRGKSILIVDDEPDLRDVFRFEFERSGARVQEAPNGRVALDLVKSTRIDVIVSDLRMPVMNGIELLKAVVALGPERPLVFLISGFTEIAAEALFEEGAQGLFQKPLDLSDLFEAVKKTYRTERRERNFPRFSCEFPTEFRLAVGSYASNGVVRVIGKGGFFLELTGPAPTPGLGLEFKIETPHGILEGMGLVRWRRGRASDGRLRGIGVEFKKVATVETLERVIAALSAAR